ncbi:hypothetical protein Cgig2_027706 [Carnegiea gigantea]|uniref:Uncharacterized protein n=1 Tax=Carnegiea gigantea TaxID=171969 RepID=A0A9Q1JW15_9CARY|nr:hypothetical protein Cgig2_027706 [Carnegiea gigantea]
MKHRGADSVEPELKMEKQTMVGPGLDALKNFMTTMTDTILQQVTEQVKKTMEAVSFIRPFLAFDYVHTTSCEPSRRCALAESLRRSNEVREIVRPERIKQSHKRNHNRSMGGDTRQVIEAQQVARGGLANSAIASTVYATHSRGTTLFEKQEQTSRPGEGASRGRHTSEHPSA